LTGQSPLPVRDDRVARGLLQYRARNRRSEAIAALWVPPVSARLSSGLNRLTGETLVQRQPRIRACLAPNLWSWMRYSVNRGGGAPVRDRFCCAACFCRADRCGVPSAASRVSLGMTSLARQTDPLPAREDLEYFHDAAVPMPLGHHLSDKTRRPDCSRPLRRNPSQSVMSWSQTKRAGPLVS
jgi:hypothetical protein